METPAQSLSNSSATKVDSLGEFSTPPRPTKHSSQVNYHPKAIIYQIYSYLFV